MNYPTITHEIHITDPSHLALFLTYTYQNPYEVALQFWDSTGQTTWVCDRTLIEDGLLAPTGIGDIRFRPYGLFLTTPHMVITLTSPTGTVHILANYNQILSFVTSMQKSFPLDDELLVITDGDLQTLTTGEEK